jgi:serine/threonine-protein kinase
MDGGRPSAENRGFAHWYICCSYRLVEATLERLGKTLLGKWHLDAVLGEGGMATVYAATHRNGARGAVKLLRSSDPDEMSRFMREGYIANHVDHPAVVRALDDDIAEDGTPFLVMELLEGESLAERATREGGRLPVMEVLRVMREVLGALATAHEHGVVHRDIKPENILIANTPEGLVVKISDFGLAKSFRGVGLSGLTFSGEMRGTVPFMPPEQMLDFKTVTPLADLYATAATLYYLLTCQYVYDEPAGGGDLIRMLLEEPSIPIRTRRPDVDPALAEVIEKCLARDPKVRFPDATSMRRALKPFC